MGNREVVTFYLILMTIMTPLNNVTSLQFNGKYFTEDLISGTNATWEVLRNSHPNSSFSSDSPIFQEMEVGSILKLTVEKDVSELNVDDLVVDYSYFSLSLDNQDFRTSVVLEHGVLIDPEIQTSLIGVETLISDIILVFASLWVIDGVPRNIWNTCTECVVEGDVIFSVKNENITAGFDIDTGILAELDIQDEQLSFALELSSLKPSNTGNKDSSIGLNTLIYVIIIVIIVFSAYLAYLKYKSIKANVEKVDKVKDVID